VFAETGFFVRDVLRITGLRTGVGNVAGVSIPTFEGADFEVARYDLVRTPLWMDLAVEKTKKVLLLSLEAEVLGEQKRRLEKELRVTTQRVNLFEKVKIPQTQAGIKKIQVYLGDQQTAAVVRGKIAKGRLEKAGA
jgi:V/A-type H+-transporting ATPase subunit D